MGTTQPALLCLTLSRLMKESEKELHLQPFQLLNLKDRCQTHVSVSAVFCLDILQLYSIGLSFVWHSVYFVQL